MILGSRHSAETKARIAAKALGRPWTKGATLGERKGDFLLQSSGYLPKRQAPLEDRGGYGCNQERKRASSLPRMP